MPTYEYRCTSCGHQFEKFQKFTDEPIKICPVCGEAVRKVFHPAGVVFKGSGWYINDSRKKEVTVTPAANGSEKNSEKTETDQSKDKDQKVEAPVAETAKTEGGDKEKGKAEPKTEKTETKKSDTPAAPAA